MPPITVMIKPVSGLCNMRCSYCFYADEMNRRDVSIYQRMSAQTLENAIRRIFAYADGSVAIAFQGGEPSLAGAAFFQELLRLERRYNSRRLPVTHMLQTNGLHLSDEMLHVLREGSFLLGVSLDGCQRIHDEKRLDSEGKPTWARVMDTIARVRQAGIPYNILCVVDRRVARAADEVFQSLQPHGYLQFIPCLDGLDGAGGPDSLTPEDYGDFLIRTFDAYARCFQSNRFVSVRAFDNWLNYLNGVPMESCDMRGHCSPQLLLESNGNAYPCDFYALDEWLLGNINETSVYRLLRSDKARQFLENSQVPDAECAQCRWAALCGGGCRREREPAVSGRLQHYRLCAGVRRFFDARFPLMQRLAMLPPPQMPSCH